MKDEHTNHQHQQQQPASKNPAAAADDEITFSSIEKIVNSQNLAIHPSI